MSSHKAVFAATSTTAINYLPVSE